MLNHQASVIDMRIVDDPDDGPVLLTGAVANEMKQNKTTLTSRCRQLDVDVEGEVAT